MHGRAIPLTLFLLALASAGCDGAPGPGQSLPEGVASSRGPAGEIGGAPAGRPSDLPPGEPYAGPADVVPFEGEALPPTIGDGMVLRVLAEGHLQPDGRMMLPAMEQDLVFLVVHLETERGVPIELAPVEVSTTSGNQVLLDQPETDRYGYAAFTLYLSEPGRAEFTVKAFGLENRFEVDAMRLEESPWLQGLQGADIIPWSELRDVRIRFSGEGFTGRIQTDFGTEIEALEGRRIRLSGYMLPMTPDPRQTAFVLSASPPNCFFHPPGGPTTLILVETAPNTPVPSTQAPIVVEGRLELVRESEYALVYMLEDAAPARF